ncbi:MAG: AraC family transcriptional regulator [Agriterribacter sp.]
MTNPNEIIPGILFYSYLSSVRKEKVCFLEHSTLVLQVSGSFKLETSGETIAMEGGQMLLIRKNQLGQITKTPLPGEDYQTIVISLQEDFLRKIAIEEQIHTKEKYTGPLNVLVPADAYLVGYFQSIIPYVNNPLEKVSSEMGILKIKEGVKLLLRIMPQLQTFLFDFSEVYKIDLEKFMPAHFHYNIPVEQFAQMTGRSLASFKRDFQKSFGTSPRQWLQEKRLTEARHLIEKKKAKPSNIYLDLGFESLSHFSYSFKKKFGVAPSALVEG